MGERENALKSADIEEITATRMGYLMVEHEDALESANRAIARDAADARAHAQRGMALVGLGRLGEALDAYSRAAELDPDDARTHLKRGDILFGLGRLTEALAAYSEALDLDPDNKPAHDGHTATLDALERHEDALHGKAVTQEA